MTTPQPGQLAPRKPVRLWPGVVMAVLLLLVRFGLPVVLAESAMLGMIGWIVGACWCSRKKRSWRWSARRRISSKRSRECRRSTARHGIIQPWLAIGCSFAMAKRWPRFASLQSKGAQFPLDAQACRCGRRPAARRKSRKRTATRGWRYTPIAEGRARLLLSDQRRRVFQTDRSSDRPRSDRRRLATPGLLP